MSAYVSNTETRPLGLCVRNMAPGQTFHELITTSAVSITPGGNGQIVDANAKQHWASAVVLIALIALHTVCLNKVAFAKFRWTLACTYAKVERH